ncbi:conjugative transposon TraJ protein [Filimonas zeae]|uniref:Conjugative transposon protein TraJ n=2 Tax=Filimonas zeae TaxID=1737353 RepID=A0A917INQ0_9BACT|nr:conjugative transposon TraJ protein [Filimonas zeae]GGH59761.1 conjugative transposon protein TraJ [Filimonas zeae]
MPLCADLINVSTAIAGLGALFYIGVRVWKHIANAEPIDFFPLFRPFVLTLLIGLFPTLVLGVLDGAMKPITLTTEKMFKKTNQSVEVLLAERAKAIVTGGDGELVGNPNSGNKNYDKYDKPEPTGGAQEKPPSLSFGLKLMSGSMSFLIKLFLSTILQMLYYAAAICIDVIRTFQLLILGILGPLVFALSIYDGFQHTLSVWIGRYINVSLWLPIANIFGSLINKIQQNMLKLDLSQIQSGQGMAFSQTDAAYIIFLIISIVGYFSIPGVANYVIHASGGNAVMGRANQLASNAIRFAIGGPAAVSAGGGKGGGSMADDRPGDDRKTAPMADAANSEPYRNDGNSYQAKKLS